LAFEDAVDTTAASDAELALRATTLRTIGTASDTGGTGGRMTT
jgi:hypothetical protein